MLSDSQISQIEARRAQLTQAAHIANDQSFRQLIAECRRATASEKAMLAKLQAMELQLKSKDATIRDLTFRLEALRADLPRERT